MKAIAVPEFGAVPRLVDLPEPVAAAGEIRVRLEGAGMNPYDWKIADGVLKDARPHVFPLVLGVDGAGTVDQVGSGVRRFRLGDRVFGQFLHDPVGRGTYADAVTAPESLALVRVPPSLSSWSAASLPTAGMTAVTALDSLALKRGETVLVVGASGGIGSILIPLAAAQGLRVAAVARSSTHDRLQRLGAAETIDVAGPDAVAAARAGHPAGVDGLVDVMSDSAGFARWAGLVRAGGAAATVVHASATVPGVRTVRIDLQPRAELLERLVQSVASGTLVPPVDRTISLADAPAVVVEGRAGRFSGKTVIGIDSRGGRAPSP